MRKKIERLDVSGAASALTSKPFSQMATTLSETVPQQPLPANQPGETHDDKSHPEFHVARTRKGGYPIFLERRPGGKVVTIIRNISGDTDVLVAALKKRCAAGGKAFADSVEIQGDHCSKVQAFLREKGL